jgi:3D (Asp-Asp-Asp) domain-containing protein
MSHAGRSRTAAVANSKPQPYPYGTTFRVANADGSTAYAGTALDTGAGWDRKHHNVDPNQWIDIWLPDEKKAAQWGVQWRNVEICKPPKGGSR